MASSLALAPLSSEKGDSGGGGVSCSGASPKSSGNCSWLAAPSCSVSTSYTTSSSRSASMVLIEKSARR